MKTEIKQRIEQIKNGQVPEGYKKTKCGILPVNWEIKKLRDVLQKQTQKNTNGEVKNVLTNSATYGIISQTEYFDKQIANEENTGGYYIVKKGYFVYNPRISVSAPCGPFNKYYGEKDGVMSPLYTVYRYIDSSEYYSEYLSRYFSSSKWYSYMNSIANYGARSDRMNVTTEDMNNMPLPYPPLSEQKNISKILALQDRIIELQQKKVDEYKKLKKAMLQRMFPKKGENVPEIRFPGFTDDWEQRKVKELCDITTGKSNTQDQVEDGLYPFYIRSEVPVKSNKYLYDCEAVITIGDGNIGKVFHYVNGKFDLHQRCYKMTDFRDVSGKYFYYYFATKFYYRVMRMSAKATVDSVRLEMISDMDIRFPKDLDEQKAIAEFLTNLDNLITLHQRKLDEYKTYKKSLMQLLLTGTVRCK